MLNVLNVSIVRMLSTLTLAPLRVNFSGRLTLKSGWLPATLVLEPMYNVFVAMFLFFLQFFFIITALFHNVHRAAADARVVVHLCVSFAFTASQQLVHYLGQDCPRLLYLVVKSLQSVLRTFPLWAFLDL